MKKTKTFSATKTVKDVVGAGVTLGVGSTVLGSMGQGAVANQIVTPASSMLGTYASAGMGMGVLGMVNNMTKKKGKK
jgi:hypothetical protein